MSQGSDRGAKRTRADEAAETAAGFTMLDRMRERVGEPGAPTRASVLRDVEAAKRLAFEGVNTAGAVRAIELEGKSIGAFERKDIEVELRKLTDEEFVGHLANGNEKVFEILMSHLNSGDWQPSTPTEKLLA